MRSIFAKYITYGDNVGSSVGLSVLYTMREEWKVYVKVVRADSMKSQSLSGTISTHGDIVGEREGLRVLKIQKQTQV